MLKRVKSKARLLFQKFKLFHSYDSYGVSSEVDVAMKYNGFSTVLYS